MAKPCTMMLETPSRTKWPLRIPELQPTPTKVVPEGMSSVFPRGVMVMGPWIWMTWGPLAPSAVSRADWVETVTVVPPLPPVVPPKMDMLRELSPSTAAKPMQPGAAPKEAPTAENTTRQQAAGRKTILFRGFKRKTASPKILTRRKAETHQRNILKWKIEKRAITAGPLSRK